MFKLEYLAGRKNAAPNHYFLEKRKLSTAVSSGLVQIRDGPLENLWGAGGGRSTEKKFAQGKI